jgi:hypothetical protein
MNTEMKILKKMQNLRNCGTNGEPKGRKTEGHLCHRKEASVELEAEIQVSLRKQMDLLQKLFGGKH